MKKYIKVRANNTIHYVANCKQLMSLLNDEQRLGWINKFKSLGVQKRDLTRSVNLTIEMFHDIWHYNCDESSCSVNYILSCVVDGYEK